MADISKEYKTISQIAGPLVYVKNTEPVGYNEIVSIRLSDGTMRRGQVLDSSNDLVVVQVFEGTTGIDRDASVRFLGETMKMPVSREMLGRVLSGAGDPLDGGAKIVPEKELDITGAAINPWARDSPSDFIQTGISTIDGMNTLVRGQKLPIFSQSGLPHNEMALQIARQAKVRGENEEFAVVFIAMGITNEEKQMFMKEFERTGALKNAVVFLNLADDPAVERTLTPRLGLTTAEYMAFDLGMQVLVIMTDITNYCEALRQIGAAREEVPGRRGYPGYMYTDLAQLYERAGRIKGKKGSITQIPILSMPGGDITHPIPDLSGYITEGQIVLSMDLHRAGIYPPVNVSSSLSRLMGGGTGAGKTREDHKNVSDQLYASYAEGKDLRGLVAIVGKDSLSAKDRKLLDFADIFEDRIVRQGIDEDRSIEETLDIAWEIFTELDLDQLTRISRKYLDKYQSAMEKITIARAVEGEIAVKSAAYALKADPQVKLSSKSIMGMMVPKVEAQQIHTKMTEKGYGVISTSAYIEEAAAAFEKLLDTLVRAAEVETTMKKLLDEIEKTKRRVNALEFKIIPELQESERFVKFRLEEMDRENTTRLKHLKKKGAVEE
mgnify:CR=1 FL=1